MSTQLSTERRAELQLAPDFKMTSVSLQITGKPAFEEWVSVGKTLQFLEGAICFALGDWVNYGEKRWGEKYAQAIEITRHTEGTLQTYAWVANKVICSIRIEQLPFGHHQLVAPIHLSDGKTPDVERQRYYLQLAVEQELSREQLRDLIKRDARQRQLQATRAQEGQEQASPTLLVGRAEKLELDDNTIDLIITSPPYNLGSAPMPMGGGGRTPRKTGIGYQDDMPELDYQAWQIEVLKELHRVAKSGASLFYNHKVRNRDGAAIHPMEWVICSEWTLRQEIVWWRKSTHNHNPVYFYPEDERIYWLTKGKPTLPDRSIGISTVWECFGAIPNTWHPAPFTDELPRMVIQAVGREGITVLDPFAGSCTTVKVALEYGYQAIGVDINPDYLKEACEVYGWTSAI